VEFLKKKYRLRVDAKTDNTRGKGILGYVPYGEAALQGLSPYHSLLKWYSFKILTTKIASFYTPTKVKTSFRRFCIAISAKVLQPFLHDFVSAAILFTDKLAKNSISLTLCPLLAQKITIPLSGGASAV